MTKLQTDPTGRTVTGVVVSHGDGGEVYTGDIVVLPPGPPTAKILLNSASDAHPHGLANGSDQVGRNYMFQICLAVVALSKEKNDTVFQKTLEMNDFYFATKDYEYPYGNIQMIGKSNAEAMRGEKPTLTKPSPEWTPVGRGRARGGLLADHRRPARTRQLGYHRRRTGTWTSPTPRPTTTRLSASTAS